MTARPAPRSSFDIKKCGCAGAKASDVRLSRLQFASAQWCLRPCRTRPPPPAPRACARHSRASRAAHPWSARQEAARRPVYRRRQRHLDRRLDVRHRARGRMRNPAETIARPRFWGIEALLHRAHIADRDVGPLQLGNPVLQRITGKDLGGIARSLSLLAVRAFLVAKAGRRRRQGAETLRRTDADTAGRWRRPYRAARRRPGRRRPSVNRSASCRTGRDCRR